MGVDGDATTDGGLGAVGPADQSDAVLISRVRDGDAAAYGLLYERHAAAARGLARHLVGNEAAAEDVVSETFAKVLSVLRRGGGPQESFRPYLLTSVRRAVYDHYRGERRLAPTDQIESYDPGEPFVDPALADLEANMIARAFRSLPERWQTVLWHTEIERQKPAQVAPLLGLTPNGVAALGYRAREGLRQAYLQMHLADAAHRPGRGQTSPAPCRPALDKLGAYIRGGLAKRDSAQVERHLDRCADCRAIYAELADVNTGLRTIVGPLVLGTAATAYLAAGEGAALGGLLCGLRQLPRRQQAALGAGAVAVVTVAAAGLTLVAEESPEPNENARPERPPAAAPPAPMARRPGAVKTARSQQPGRPGARSVTPGVEPAAAPPRPMPVRLTPTISPVGSLVRGSDGIVVLSVRNAGAEKSRPLAADVALPPGVTFLGGRSGRTGAARSPLSAPGGGWTCGPDERGATCAHGPLGARAAATVYLHVDVAPQAPFGEPPQVLLRSRDVRVRARAAAGVLPAGLPARFAADGRLDTVHGGNALLGCDAPRPGRDDRDNRRGGNRRCDPRPVDLDHDAATKSSSSARLPVRGRVQWAGLYWSEIAAEPRDEPAAVRVRPPRARVRPPGANAYQTVRAGRVERVRLPDATVSQGFADVTALVREHGGGRWWVADAPGQAGEAGAAGRPAPVGWALVAVVRDQRAPARQIMILDGARALGPESGRGTLGVPIAGLFPAAAPARLGLIGWQGDSDQPGDRVLLGGSPLTPATGDRDPANVFDGSACGAIGPARRSGTDVDEFTANLDNHRGLTLTTGRDALVAGVLTVAVPMRS
jgi:RNA polymerase sigma factor (sigma-70 family)